MVTRDTAWLPGTPCWADVAVDSLPKAVEFYSALFGWQADVNEEFGYGNFNKDGRQVAGAAPKQDAAQPSVWTTYIASDNAEQTAEKIKNAGGQVLAEPFAVGEFGTMAIATDPSGAMFGLWQSGTHTGFRLANEDGTVVWNENLSGDFEGNKKFYTEVFGYEYGDIGGDDGYHYATLGLNGSEVGGIGDALEGMPEGSAQWLTYFSVPDTDAAVARVSELGGTVVQEPFDTPYGRIGIVADDQGAVFALIKGAEPAE